MTTIIPPEQEARAVLMARRTRLDLEAIDQAERLAEKLEPLNPSQVRGLANALSVGPDRRTFQARRAELARFLAWRAHRANDDEAAWTKQVCDTIACLEEQCAEEVDEERRAREGYWQAHASALREGQAWLEMTVLEAFIHALERQVMARSADE